MSSPVPSPASGGSDGPAAGAAIFVILFAIFWFALGIYAIVIAARCPWSKSPLFWIAEVALAFFVGPIYLPIKAAVNSANGEGFHLCSKPKSE